MVDYMFWLMEEKSISLDGETGKFMLQLDNAKPN